MQANYPRLEIRKHLGRVADNYFKIEYEEHKVFDPFSKLKLMEDQMRTELAYINKLSKMTLSHAVSSDYKSEISQALIQINSNKYNIERQEQSDKNFSSKQSRYKHKQTVAFPGKNDYVLDDMVKIADQPIINKSKNFQSKEKRKTTQKSSTLSMTSTCELL